MNREKIVGKIAELKILLDDWDDLESHDLQKQAETLVIQKAAELVEIVTDELVEIATEEVKPKKSEMACNCSHDCENFEDIAEEFEKANASLEDILKRMTQEEKDALTAKICTEMYFEILKLVRNAVES